MTVKGKFVKKKGYSLLGNKVIPRGSNCFYLNLKNGFGLKVYYGLDRRDACSEKVVEKIARRMKRYSDIGAATEPLKVIPVKVDIKYDGDKIKETCYAIKTKHMDMAYSKGKKEAKKKLARKLEKNGITVTKDSMKDTNIGYDKKQGRFKLVDVA